MCSQRRRSTRAAGLFASQRVFFSFSNLKTVRNGAGGSPFAHRGRRAGLLRRGGLLRRYFTVKTANVTPVSRQDCAAPRKHRYLSDTTCTRGMFSADLLSGTTLPTLRGSGSVVLGMSINTTLAHCSVVPEPRGRCGAPRGRNASRRRLGRAPKEEGSVAAATRWQSTSFYRESLPVGR